TKIVFLTLDQAANILSAKAKNGGDPKTITMIFADYIGEIIAWNESFMEITEETYVKIPENYVVERTIDKYNPLGLGLGSFSIQKMSWRATEWYDTSDNIGRWKTINSPEDPGYECKIPIVFNNKEDILAHLEFVDCHTLKIKLPSISGKANYPANRLSKDKNGKLMSKGHFVRIRINIYGCYVAADFNGAALRGNIWMTTFGGEIAENGLGCVLLHELGHNMGQVYASKSTDPVFGRSKGKEIPGIPFPPDVNNGGKTYGGHGHQGTHCAEGITNKRASSFHTQEAIREHKCIMFGASDLSSNIHFDYCEECRNYIKAEDLSSIRKDWS
ncbi:MAG: hypothetical protein N2053_03485, partial [Chitinispirillaceae bacterium]|nr:hypothetical protein [Chitinispirillaceae bacterium]